MGNKKHQQKNRGTSFENNSSGKAGQSIDGLEKQKKQEEVEEKKDARLEEYGQAVLSSNSEERKIYLLSIIGEVEGHENLPGNSKATKYDHILPKLAELEDDKDIEGVLVLLNTSGGDVDAGLAIAEMIASLSMPTVSLVLGGSHSIGVPLAVCTDYSFIVPTGTMMIHPVRMNGMVIGAEQTYEYFGMIQDRILSFVSSHAVIPYDKLKQLMHNTEMLTRDLGTVLVGEETVKEGLINEVGGIKEALSKLYQMIDGEKKKQERKR
ncbi:ATP-dependent Clp protease proteolytic subunit [Lachnospiraceae bacterium 62-35]